MQIRPSLGIVGIAILTTTIILAQQHQAHGISVQEIEKNMTSAQKAELNRIFSSASVMNKIIAIGLKYTWLTPNFNGTVTPDMAKQASTEGLHIPEIHDFARNPEPIKQNQTLMKLFNNSSEEAMEDNNFFSLSLVFVG